MLKREHWYGLQILQKKMMEGTLQVPPYIIGDKIIIGHGGADFRPIRGYVTAYDLESGEEEWRFLSSLKIQKMVLKMRL